MSSFKRLLTKMVLTSFLVTTVFSQSGFSTAGVAAAAYETNGMRIIVKYKDESKADLVKNNTKNKLNLLELSSKKKFKKGNMELLEVDGNTNVDLVLNELKDNSAVEFAQEDYQVKLGSAANDTLNNEQWALKNNGQAINGVTGTSNTDLSAENAWDITKGNSNVVVAVLDTDLDISHEDLNQNVWVNSREIPNNGIDDDNNGYIDDVAGFDFANNSNTVYSSVYGQSHATHLAGIIAAVSNNSKGVSGIAPKVKIMPLKFVNNGIGYTSDAIEAIQYAEANGATIANCSWWTSENNIALKDAISTSNMLFVTAAGNSGANNDLSPVYPANFNLSNVISVAALDNQGNLASFSNYGLNNVDIAAPGKDIISTIPGNGYSYLSGTSMSSAYTSGVAALVKSKTPSMTASQIKEQIKSTAVSNPNISNKILNGRALNAYYALGGQQANTPNEQTSQTGNNTNIIPNISEPPQDLDQYAAWKQNLSNAASSDSQVSTLGYSNGKMYNDYIEYVVANGGSSNGRFTIGTTGGNPDNAYDNYKRMLFGHPSPWSSYTTVKLDGSNYIYNPTTQYPTPNTTDLSNTSEYRAGNVSVNQIVSIVKSTSTQRDDTVQLKYIVKNNDSVNHDAGLRIMMDTMLGSNDAAPFRIPGIGAVSTETELTGDNIPEYWQAFDSLTNPTVISQGTLLRSLNNKPDKVQFTNWGRVYNNPWMTTVNTGSSNGDSAVSVYWNPKALTPGETREYVTYYGLSELQQDLRPPLAISLTGANNIVATESGYNPNPFTVTAYIMNNGNGAADNVKAKIELPSGLKLAGGQQTEISLNTLSPNTQEKQVSWQIEIEESNIDRNLTYSVILSADNTATKTISRNIFIPASVSINPITDVQVQCSSNSSTVTWKVPVTAYGNIAMSNSGGYYASLPYDSGIVVASTGLYATQTRTFNDLSPNTNYDYTIVAYDKGHTYSYNGSFQTRTREVVIVIPGIAGTSLSISHMEGNNENQTTHDVWKPRSWSDEYKFGTLEHDMNQLECDVNGYPLQSLSVGQPLDDYYGDIFRTLGNRGFDVYYFGYDWRRGNAYTAELLESFINSLGVDKVSIVAHSMGGLVATNYISNGNANKVNKLITLGTPYLGAPKALYVFETGKLLGAPYDWAVASHIKRLAQNLSSVYQLLPIYNYFDFNSTYYVQECIDNDWFKSNNYDELAGYDETMNLIKSRNWANSGLVEKALNFHNSLDLINTLKSVDSYFIIGDKQTTIGKIREKYEHDDNGNLVFKESDDIKNINGDGTVPVISGNIGGKTEVIHSDHTYYIDDEHSNLPKNAQAVNQVIGILNGSNNVVEGVRREYENTWTLKLKIECPVDLHVYDNSGNHMGQVNQSEYEEKIKAGSYYLLGDKKIALLQDANYNVKLVGTSRGTMTYTLQRFDDNNNLIKTIRFDNVNVTEQSVITSNTDFDGTIVLMIDDNNDGNIDRTVQPSVVLDQNSSNDSTAPQVSINIEGVIGNNGWFTSDVKVNINAQDNGSGVDRVEYINNDSGIQTYTAPLNVINEGNNKIYAVAVDKNCNKSDAALTEFKIDKTEPDITVKSLIDSKEFLLNEKVVFDWAATDTVSGLDSSSSTIANGSYIDTSSVGTKTITITAKDNAGNVAVKVLTYYVGYLYSGVFQPLNSNGLNDIKIGRTVPIKFQLKDADGKYIENAFAKLYLVRITNGVPENEIEAISTSNATTTGNLFRYDETENQYIYNLNTKNISSGACQLKIVLDDSSSKYVNVVFSSK
ncbi:MAG: hypothetical protein APF81_05395 [Desulfosporosinus sp. BRH_c37]|nr:MAG: hypothetical protein APF81_05395 [Desulfosporosinus sp. BRH_c37]